MIVGDGGLGYSGVRYGHAACIYRWRNRQYKTHRVVAAKSPAVLTPVGNALVGAVIEVEISGYALALGVGTGMCIFNILTTGHNTLVVITKETHRRIKQMPRDTVIP